MQRWRLVQWHDGQELAHVAWRAAKGAERVSTATIQGEVEQPLDKIAGDILGTNHLVCYA
jgi:hypothetical protein